VQCRDVFVQQFDAVMCGIDVNCLAISNQVDTDYSN